MTSYSKDIIKQLGKDAPYAWFLYDRAKQHARYTFADFREQAERVEACLDALSIALTAGEPVEAWLDGRDWGTGFVLVQLAIRHDQARLFDLALERLAKPDETHPREIADACLWLPHAKETLQPWLLRLAQHPAPAAHQAAIAVSRATGIDLDKAAGAQLAADTDPQTIAQLLHWLAERGSAAQLPFVRQHYQHANTELAFAAARAGALLGDPEGKAALGGIALSPNPWMLDALALILVGAGSAAIKNDWIQRLWAAEGAPLRVKLYAVAMAGLPENVDRLFAPMADIDSSRAAGEALTVLTGADIELENLDAASGAESDCDALPVDGMPTLAERRAVDPFVTEWEDDLPFPCPDATSDWWQKHRQRFTNGTTYLAGQATEPANLHSVLRSGNQRQRHLAALHLRMRHQQPWFDCGWPCWRQERALSLLPDPV